MIALAPIDLRTAARTGDVLAASLCVCPTVLLAACLTGAPRPV